MTGWLGTWKYRLPVVISADLIAEDLAWFPVALFIRDASGIGGADLTPVFDEIGANNLKLAVTKADGVTQLYAEIDTWDAVAEEAVLHVSKSDWTVTNVGDTLLYLYFDRAQDDNTDYVGVVNSTPGEAVWNDAFVMVQHMNDYDTSHIKDSTHYHNDGTKLAANEPAETAAGAVGKAQVLDGMNDHITCPLTDSLKLASAFTVESWFIADKIQDNKGLLAQYVSSSDRWQLYIDTNPGLMGRMKFGGSDGVFRGSSPFTISQDQLYYAVGVRNESNDIALYRNGDVVGGFSTGWSGDTQTSLEIGLFYSTSYCFSGTLDEVRISNVARSAPWILTTKYTLTDALLMWGTLETAYFADCTLASAYGLTSSESITAQGHLNVTQVMALTQSERIVAQASMELEQTLALSLATKRDVHGAVTLGQTLGLDSRPEAVAGAGISLDALLTVAFKRASVTGLLAGNITDPTLVSQTKRRTLEDV